MKWLKQATISGQREIFCFCCCKNCTEDEVKLIFDTQKTELWNLAILTPFFGIEVKTVFAPELFCTLKRQFLQSGDPIKVDTSPKSKRCLL